MGFNMLERTFGGMPGMSDVKFNRTKAEVSIRSKGLSPAIPRKPDSAKFSYKTTSGEFSGTILGK